MLKELPKVGQVVIAVRDEYEWESDRRYLTCSHEYEVVDKSDVSGNTYIIDDLGDKCFIDDAAFHLYELKDSTKWDETKDMLTLNELEYDEEDVRLEINANYESWEVAKQKEYPFYIGITEGKEQSESAIQLNASQAEQLRDYLSHKLNYLEEEN